MNFRILLSPPDLAGDERSMLLEALDSNWIAPAGPHLERFEQDVADRTGRRYAIALSSGTAGLHLALMCAGVSAGDEVVVPTLTFAATANAVCYLGARPLFVDVDPKSWNIDTELLAEELAARAQRRAKQPTAIVPVDLYGRCTDYQRLLPIAQQYGIPVIADAAEALGATHHGEPAGSFGQAAVLSFNGNKIITTSGGGMVVSDDTALAQRVRYLATQAREPVRHYEHREIGFNYRMSNLLAALGIAQLAQLDNKVARRRAINARYRTGLVDTPGISFPPRDPDGTETHWLTCLTIDPRQAGVDRDTVIDALADSGIEARPTWKPMHLQPVFSGIPVIGGDIAAHIFENGLCLPSGSQLTDGEQDEIIEVIRSAVASSITQAHP